MPELDARVAVVIPAKNEAARIAATVAAALTIESVDLVVVVDDGSSDQTAVLATGAGATVTRHERTRGKAAAMETGAELVRLLDQQDDVQQPRPLLFLDADLEDTAAADPLEAKAKAKHLNYVKLDGEVGIIGNGAGLVMSTLDVVAYAGEKHGGVKPANFLDIGGGASAEVMAAGLDVILNDSQVKSVFVNVFGGITACDAVANGIVEALGILGDEASKPLVVRLDGNNVDEGRRILAEANHPLVTVVDTMDDAAGTAAELASKAGA